MAKVSFSPMKNTLYSPLSALRALLGAAFLLLFLGMAPQRVSAAIVDIWRADSLNLNDGDTVGTWISASNRTANSAVGIPIFKRNVTPAGGPAVRFNRNRMAVSTSPMGGRTAFSIALVFRADAVGAGENAQWYGKTGLIDAEQGGVTADWGTVLTETGNVGIGIGAGDTSLYSTGSSLADSNYHVAVFTWGGGSQSVFVDARPGVTTGSATAARNTAAMSFGGIQTDENGASRRLVGDMVEIRIYDTALTSLEASNVIDDLRTTHLFGNLPRIFSFGSSTNQIYLGQSVTLSWAVSNATSIVIDGGVGTVTASNSIVLSPTATTTYSLTATNTNGVRTALVTVAVDPGIPSAFNFSTNTAYNTGVAITLRGSDPQGSNLTYSIVNPPSHGSLSGVPPAVTYTPANNYGGLDAFTFKVNDGAFDSSPATVSLNVIPPALPPSGIVLSTTNISSGAGPGAFIAALQAIDINNLYGDTHTFGLAAGGADNAKFAVSGRSLFAGPSFVGGPGATFNVRLKTTDSTGLSYTQDVMLVVHDTPRAVVINEFHYNPSFNPVRESFIELYNDTSAMVDLSNWRVRGGVDYFFPANTFLAAHAFAVVADDPATIQSRYGVAAYGPWSGGLNNDGDEITLRDALNNVVDTVNFNSEFPWPVAANGNGPSAQLVNPSFDNDLGSSWRSAPPSPGATNSVFSTNAPPHLRQVDNAPNWPRSTNQVTITAKVTDPDGVASVSLAYQVVVPGNYIPATLPLTGTQLNNLNSTPLTNSLNPAFELPANWTTVSMHDDGANGDAVAGDGIYSVVLPQQANRSLVRYRVTCTDALGASRRAPFEDDPSLNFAYFVYDGIPNYLGFSSASLQTLPVFFMLTRDVDVNQCAAWFAPFNNGTDQLPQGIGAARNTGRLYFNWEAAFVQDGKVFDHVHYRLRGANGRYQNGKRSFRIKFNDGALIQPVDNSGRKFPTKWREITTGKGQSNRGGEQFALNEVVSYFLWNKVGVPAPNTFYFHFRVIRGASETGADQYSGDFWGLNWAQEKYDGRFMDAHNMPKGNLYKLVDNYISFEDEERYQGTYAPTNGADYFNVQNNLNGFQTVAWLNAHANYTNWYRYFTVARAIRHYDTWPSSNKNGAWYFEPNYDASNDFFGRMIQMPYDSTDTWGATWNNGDDLLFNGIFPSTAIGGDQAQHPEMQIDFRNVARELRTLLFQTDQIYPIIDSFAAVAKPVAVADAARWSNAPAPASYLSLAIPSSPGVTGGLPGYQQDMKNFMFVGGNNGWWVSDPTYVTTVPAGGWIGILDGIIADTAIPNRPTLAYTGTNGFPIDGLIFQSSSFSDPQGAGTFAAMQWRIAEVMAPGTVLTNPSQLRLEWDSAWTSPELSSFNSFYTFPDFVTQPDLLYRARVRHKDDTGRWSQWSLPVEFRPSPRDTVSQLRTNLVFSEIMYNPPAEGATDGDEFEFIELQNTGPFTLNLGGLFFSSGVNFSFTNGTVLGPNGVFLLARNAGALATRYPGVIVNGIYSGKLDNDGETVAIRHPSGGEIVSVTYGDRGIWPVTADGFGFSLVRDPSGAYRSSANRFGSPGASGGVTQIGGVVINEVLSGSTLPLKDSIELLNLASTNVDISGWWLSDDPTLPQKFRIPAGPSLAPGAVRVFTEDDFNPTPGFGVSFSFSSLGDDAYVFSGDAGGNLTGYSHGFSFGAAQDGVSFGRYVNSVGDEQFPAQLSATFGAVNSGPRIGSVVLSEINYHPRNAADEFIELRNRTGSPVPLYDTAHTTNTWRVNGIGFSLPTGVTLAANGCLLLVSDSPAAFRARWNVPGAIAILQYSGNLQDSGEELELQAPDLPTTNGVPFYAVDTIRYNDRKPWPLSADGAGASLQRLVPGAYGNDPTNWVAAIPTPGTHGLSGSIPAITTQPVSRTNGVSTMAMFSVSAMGSQPLFYQWRANGANVDGATNSTLILPSLQLSDAGSYQAVVYNSAGSADSSNALLVVRIGPGITNQPTNFLVRVAPDPQGSPTNRATFNVGASTYNPPLFYQWRFNGVDIPNATNSTLTFSNVTLANEGIYTVLVTDGTSSSLSAPASLIGLITPVIIQAPLSQTVAVGARVNASVAIIGNPPPFGYQWRSNSLIYPLIVSNSRTNFVSLPAATIPFTNTFRVIVTNLASQLTSVNVPFTVIAAADADNDGMPDSFELANGGNATTFDPLGDADGDGMSNLAEYLAGTDPGNSSSYLRIDLGAILGTATVQFAAISNRTYTVQYTDALPATGAWTGLVDFLARTTNRIETFPDPAWTTNRFYRVVTPRQP
ncbi:MAG: hypothetical protein QOF48_265 [Verrucomicrobiota bacterium]|jgi:hypothetical protein